MPASVTPADVWTVIRDVRDTGPLIHNVTNYVAMDVSANALLAAGASPAMVHAVDEVTDFAGIASAVVVNIGTLSAPWVEAMRAAAEVAVARGIPWVLDPVGVGATPYRTKVAADLLGLRPTVVRCNASEALALAGAAAAGKGVDSIAGTDEATEAAASLAVATGGIVAVTGVVDLVTDGHRAVGIGGGHPLMARVTALGCSASALVGAGCAVAADAFVGTASALAAFGAAGARAGAAAAGPGSFRVALLDELHGLDEPTILSDVDLREPF